MTCWMVGWEGWGQWGVTWDILAVVRAGRLVMGGGVVLMLQQMDVLGKQKVQETILKNKERKREKENTTANRDSTLPF